VVSKIPRYSIGRFALIVLCLAIVLVLVVTVLPIYLDITAFKGPVEEILSEVAEAPVTVGEIRLHPSLWPTLRVSGAEVAGAAGVDSPPFARIDKAEIKISLLPLLRKQLQLKRFLASEAVFYAHRPEGRSGNWPVSTTKAWKITELAGIELENVTIHLEDHQTVRATMVIDHLTSDIAKNRPLDLELRGSLEGLPLSFSAGGPTLAAPLSQASDFPLSLQLRLADLRLDLEGSASREPGGTKFQASFDLQSNELAFLRDLGYQKLPQVGEVQLSGMLSNSNATLEISTLEGFWGPTTVHGRLALDLPEGRPSVSGRLSLGTLDLEPWLASSNDSESDTSAPLPFSLLSATNTDLKLSLKELTGLEIAVDDIDLEVELANGVLSAPITLRAAGVPLSAELEVRAQETPEISSRVWVRDLSLGQLGRIVDIPDELDGRFGALDLEITSSGNSIDALRANLLVEAEATETAVTFKDEIGEEPVQVFLSQIHATYRPGSPLAVAARGTLFDESFTVELQTASLTDLVDNDEWPLSLRMQGAGATLELAGTLELEATGLDFDLQFGLAGDRAGALENWLGFPSHADHPYSLTGQVTFATGTRLLRLDESFIGRTRFAGEFAWSGEDEDEPFMVTLHATALDLRQLQDLSNSVTDLDTEQDVIGIDMPILPSKKSFHDAEIELTVDRLLRDPIDLTNANASLHIRQGRLERSPFSFAYNTQQFTGEISLDLHQEIPRLALAFHGHGERLGEILEKEGIVDGSLIAAKQVDLRIDAYGASVREIIRSADLSGQLVDVHWQIQPAEFDEPLTIRLDHLDLSGPRGQPIVLTGAGFLLQEPLDLRLQLRSSKQPQTDQEESLPFDLTIGLAATKIELNGELQLPVTRGLFDTQMVVEGMTLATLSPLVDMDLPDIGPYQLKSRLAIAEGGFTLKELDLSLGESDLRGEIGYRRVEDRPTFTADLTSQLIRTEDLFQLDPEAEDDDRTAEKPPETRKLTLDGFNGFDADIKLAALNILTPDGSTENMSFDLNLERGSLDLFIQRHHESSHSDEVTARIRPWQEGLQAEVQATWDRQPYGWLTEVLKPGMAKGSWSIDLDLRSRGSSVQELAANLAGYVDFADYPVNANATMLDLWGAGLLNSLLPLFQLGTESQINCAVAKFQVENGVLTPELLIIDSTRSRIRGKGTIDLPSNKIGLRLKPRPKQRRLISLATPVSVRGPLTDPNVQISKGGMAVTFFRLSLWVYTVWRDLVRKPLPADGRDVCVDPFAAPQKQ
jgi:uncharacterized protein involved in outer membrane biogenesis